MTLVLEGYVGFESGNTAECYSISKTPTVSAMAQPYAGDYGVTLAFAGTGAEEAFDLEPHGYANYGLLTFYAKWNELSPDPAYTWLRCWDETAAARNWYITVDGGALKLYDANGVLRDTWSTNLSADDWYRWHIYWYRHATAGDVHCWVKNATDDPGKPIVVAGEQRLEISNQNTEAGAGDIRYEFCGQYTAAGVPSTGGQIAICRVAQFTTDKLGNTVANLDEGPGIQDWDVPAFYGPRHGTAQSHWGDDLDTGNWSNLDDVPPTVLPFAAFTATGDSGRVVCNNTSVPEAYGPAHDVDATGVILGASWLFYPYKSGKEKAHFGKGIEASFENYATSAEFSGRSGAQYFWSTLDSIVPYDRAHEFILVGFEATDVTATAGSLSEALGFVLHVPKYPTTPDPLEVAVDLPAPATAKTLFLTPQGIAVDLPVAGTAKGFVIDPEAVAVDLVDSRVSKSCEALPTVVAVDWTAGRTTKGWVVLPEAVAVDLVLPSLAKTVAAGPTGIAVDWIVAAVTMVPTVTPAVPWRVEATEVYQGGSEESTVWLN